MTSDCRCVGVPVLGVGESGFVGVGVEVVHRVFQGSGDFSEGAAVTRDDYLFYGVVVAGFTALLWFVYWLLG